MAIARGRRVGRTARRFIFLFLYPPTRPPLQTLNKDAEKEEEEEEEREDDLLSL